MILNNLEQEGKNANVQQENFHTFIPKIFLSKDNTVGNNGIYIKQILAASRGLRAIEIAVND